MRRRTQHSIAIALLTGLGFAASAALAPAASEALNEALYAELL